MYCCPLQLITLTGIKDLSILQPAADFLRVCALGQPAVLMLMVTQAAMLAQQDAVVPGLVIFTATALSIMVRALGQPAVLMLMVTQAAMLAQQDAVVPGLVIFTATALVRALGQPAVLMLMVTQAAMLAQQDAVVPGFVISTATALSIAGHFILVKGMGWGLMGAAYSTTTANIVGALALLIASEMRGKLKPRVQVPTKEDIASMTSTVADCHGGVPYPLRAAPPTDAFLLGFCQVLGPVEQAALTYIPAAQKRPCRAGSPDLHPSCPETVANARNREAGPVEQAALTFIPAAQKRWQMLETGKLVMTLGPLVGLIGGCFVYATTMFSPQLFSADPTLYPFMCLTSGWALLFSADPALNPFMCLTSGWALVSLIFSGVDISANGMTIALGDSAYVAKSLVLTLGCIFIFTSLCRYYLWGLEGIWIGIMVFFLVRAKRSSYRIFLEFRAPPVAPKEAPGPETAAGTA
eukprot:gene29812-7449_t